VSNFDVAKPFNYGYIEAFIKSVLKDFSPHGIGPNNFSRAPGDGLFGYLISFSLFNGNATFALNRDGLVSTISNGQTSQDADLIMNVLRKAIKCLPGQEQLTHALTCFCHGEFVEGGGVESVFSELVNLGSTLKPMSLAVSNEGTAAPTEQVRMDIAPSEFREKHLFIGWQVTTRDILSDEFWAALPPRLEAVAKSVGIEFATVK
jgi:hypothetical protein